MFRAKCEGRRLRGFDLLLMRYPLDSRNRPARLSITHKSSPHNKPKFNIYKP